MPRAFDGYYKPRLDNDPSRQLNFSNPTKQPNIGNLAEIAIDNLIKAIGDNLERIPILGSIVKALKGLLDFNQDGEFSVADLKYLFSGQAIIDAIMNGFGFLGSGFGIGALVDAFLNLPMHVYNAIKGLITAVFDPSWLANITAGQIGSGASENLLTNPSFEGEVSLTAEAGWTYDATVGRTAAGSAHAAANGSRRVLANKVIKGDAGQQLVVGGWVKWSGVAGTGRLFTVELLPVDASGAELAPVVVGGITNPAASGGWQQIKATVPWPANAVSVRTRIVVEAACTAGSVWWDDLETRKTGTIPKNLITGLVDQLADLANGVLGVGNAIAGFLTGVGGPIAESVIGSVVGLVTDALKLFTGNTSQTAVTADEAQGVGGNALTNTVSIQAQVLDLKDQQDSAVTERSLSESMDFTADSTFNYLLMDRATSHTHTWSGSLSSGRTDQQGGLTSGNGSTSRDSAGNLSGSDHSHSASVSIDWRHVHNVTGTITGTNSTASSEYTAYTFTSSQAYIGFIRCRSAQEKRVFSFKAYYTAAVGDLRLDIYRLDKSTGNMTLLHTSSNLSGALTTTADWVQYVIPSSTPGIKVSPGDILGVQIRITSGTMAIKGLDSLVTSNPPGYLPRRVGMIRGGQIGAPATMNESVWSAGAGLIPYIEAGVDTGQASGPLSIGDNFDGSLSERWLMTGANEIGIASNNIGITASGTSLADGWAWGRFNTQLRTDQARAGFTTTDPSEDEQVVWFKGNGPNNHIGLAITSSYATLYTMSGGKRTNRLQVAIGTVGADYEIRYNASSKLFTVLRNGSQIGSWADSGNVAPAGLGNRFGGVGLHATRGAWFGLGSTKASPIDNWILADM